MNNWYNKEYNKKYHNGKGKIIGGIFFTPIKTFTTEKQIDQTLCQEIYIGDIK